MIVTLALTLTGAMSGPTFFGPDGAVVEALVMIALGALLGIALALRSARSYDDPGTAGFEQPTRSGNG